MPWSPFKATRNGYRDALLELGRESDDVVVLDCDLSKSTGSNLFGEKFPDRFFNCGIAEQSMMGTAAGLAASGKVCYTGSFAIFATGRAYEQIRNAIAYCNLNVKICPTHAGITVGPDGGSHQSIADISLMRALPNMKVVAPADYFEAKAAVKAAYTIDGPVYIRLGRPVVPKIYSDDYEFQFGKAGILRNGNDVAIVAVGIMVAESLKAAEMLARTGINAQVINSTTIKPLDDELIIAAAARTGLVVTAEEHSIIGGLGSAVSELLSEKLPTRVVRVGVRDKFGTSGSPAELMKHYHLTADDIVEKVKSLL